MQSHLKTEMYCNYRCSHHQTSVIFNLDFISHVTLDDLLIYLRVILLCKEYWKYKHLVCIQLAYQYLLYMANHHSAKHICKLYREIHLYVTQVGMNANCWHFRLNLNGFSSVVTFWQIIVIFAQSRSETRRTSSNCTSPSLTPENTQSIIYGVRHSIVPYNLSCLKTIFAIEKWTFLHFVTNTYSKLCFLKNNQI